MSLETVTRVTHADVRRVCTAEERKDFVTCPVCGGHLHLFGTDSFACMGNSSHPACNVAEVASKLHEMLSGTSFVSAGEAKPKVKKLKPSEMPDWRGYTIDDYCATKRIDRRLLEYLFGPRVVTRRNKPVIAWSYCDELGKVLAQKIRLSSSSHDTYFEPADPHVPYGLINPHLQHMVAKGYDLVVAEGETDTHTFAAWGYPVIGVSGAEGWLPEFADMPLIENAKRVFIAEHQDEGGRKFSAKILRCLPQALILRPGQGVKDFNELHLKHVDFEDGAFEQHPFIQSVDIAIQAATFERAMRQPKRPRPKPAPMREEAFHGLAGKVVALLEPVLETDRAAILSNFLGLAGVLFDHNAYVKVLADFHYPTDYFMTVGNSAISRKGTTTGAVLEVMERTRAGYKSKIIRGLSTGQGLIAALIKPHGKDTGEEEEENISEPIAPSVLVEVSEFAELLAVMKREENTLSAVMRDAWDGKPLAVLTRNQPLKVGNVSLSTIAHITRTELLNKLTSTDRANGFANRFLFIWSERSKLLPRGDMSRLNYNPIVTELNTALKAAEIRGSIERDEAAEMLWAEEYKRLTTRGDTMTDALLSRAEAHVVRLSLLYALLDSSPVICVNHLQAALAVWDFCEESVLYIFGENADPENTRILRKLEDGPMTNGEIRRYVFGDHKTADWVAEKMLALEYLRKVRRGEKPLKSKTVTAWYLAEYLP